VSPLISVDGDANVLIESVKLADDRSGDVVVRLYEAHGVPGAATIRPSFNAAAFLRTDLLEQPAADGGDGPRVRLRPFQIATIRIPRIRRK
jgi:alpha-mannosidase